jgi:hypothetical protein
MSTHAGEGGKADGLHAELEALRREVAELRASRSVATTSQHTPPSSDNGDGGTAVMDEIKAMMEELAESIEGGITKRPVAYVLGALLAGILVGRMLSR